VLLHLGVIHEPHRNASIVRAAESTMLRKFSASGGIFPFSLGRKDRISFPSVN
jgi:hypothetical protein